MWQQTKEETYKVGLQLYLFLIWMEIWFDTYIQTPVPYPNPNLNPICICAFVPLNWSFAVILDINKKPEHQYVTYWRSNAHHLVSIHQAAVYRKC